MDVSAVIREVEPAVDPLARAAPVRRRGEDAPQPRSERHDQPAPQRAPLPAPPPATRHIDPSEGVAERASAGLDHSSATARARDAGASSEELRLPGWVRLTYASRARRGWFLPAPTDLAGYGEEEHGKE